MAAILFLLLTQGVHAEARNATGAYLTRVYHVQSARADVVGAKLDLLCSKYQRAQRLDDARGVDLYGDQMSDLLERENLDVQIDEVCGE